MVEYVGRRTRPAHLLSDQSTFLEGDNKIKTLRLRKLSLYYFLFISALLNCYLNNNFLERNDTMMFKITGYKRYLLLRRPANFKEILGGRRFFKL